MFKLTEEELQLAFEAIEHHGFSTLFPRPPEWDDIRKNWTDLKGALAAEDLDAYIPNQPLRVFAPKNRFNLRVVTHLHPMDLIIYTALVLIVKADIERARCPQSKKRVFSFRSDLRVKNNLYQTKDSFLKYKAQLAEKASKSHCKYIAMADIADFYPRIYQHRLENVVATVATQTRGEEVARVLVKKFIFNLVEGTSYGIPVGPYASRILAEGLMIDVDDALATENLNYVRWVDDFTFFCRSDAEAQYALFFLARWLFEKHGLTLQGAKTRIISPSTFKETYLKNHEDRLAESASVLKTLWGSLSPYDDDDQDDLTADEKSELEQTNFLELLSEALSNKDSVDYEMISFLLGRLSSIEEFKDEWRLEMADTVIRNIEHLYPVIDSVAQFFTCISGVPAAKRKQISNALLKPILGSTQYRPPEYYVMWVLSIFMSDPKWNNADKILKIFNDSRSEVVRRYAALALAVTGNRSHALAIRDAYSHSSPLVKLGILRASRMLGSDERKFWKRAQLVAGPLEKRI